MTRRQYYGIVALLCILFFGSLTLAMGIYAVVSPPPPEKEISAPAWIAIGGLMTIGSVTWLYRMARNGWRAWAVTAAAVAGEPVLYGRGYYSQGMTSGQGFVVCRPGFVAILPTQPIRHALGEMAGQVASAVVSNLGVDIMTFTKKPLGEWIDELRTSNPRDFDATIIKAADQLKGITWRANEITVDYDAQSSKPKKRMSFKSQKAIMGFMRKLSADQQETAGAMCMAIGRRATAQ